MLGEADFEIVEQFGFELSELIAEQLLNIHVCV
jgi:hypothetical protein